MDFKEPLAVFPTADDDRYTVDPKESAYNFLRAWEKEIQTALKLADRLQSGEFSEGMYDACSSVSIEEWQKLAAQMLKEAQND